MVEITTNKHELLTDDEKKIIAETGECPDCEEAPILMIKPKENGIRHYRCDNPECASEFLANPQKVFTRQTDARPGKPQG